MDASEQVQEQQLVARAQQGDPAALAAIVEAHQQRIYHVALRMCGNPQDAEETLQETFLKAIQALPRFEGRSRLSTWLYRIASNLCLMQRRRDAAEPLHFSVDVAADGSDGEAEDLFPPTLVDWSYDPDALLLDAELRQVMEEAIGQLPPKLRLVFIWRDLEGLSTGEVAEVLGISESAVKVRLHRARLQLRERLSAYFAERPQKGDTHG
ncbi:sigma-70 family RNA polymerase sigma factor [Litorilinea aerophila]|uniref:Sigma-70 family RNA polymerase sigma factor n=1 Tax=Litorilinea aerophila TaxID=1204385 RepID=A0A540VDR2_9CHLR|nr:sigma-70 family RNA polymerase sigma factor [Litorilinea aerophila]MCC9077418.1 sigma-70 family RNA polymerase sigma factor [Litorilinea aerophila]GIV80048.1 MAG: RNA polymerase subunit sigma-24 [Litorilinea sp.]